MSNMADALLEAITRYQLREAGATPGFVVGSVLLIFLVFRVGFCFVCLRSVSVLWLILPVSVLLLMLPVSVLWLMLPVSVL